MLDSIALGMVMNHDMTGYDINKMIKNSIGVFYKASFGSLYPALKKLTQKGYLNTYEKPQGSRRKIFYQITEEGKQCFLDWLSAPMDILDGTNTHLAKVYFFDQLPQDIREHQLLQHEINNINYLKKLQDLEKQFSKLDDFDCHYYKLSTLYYGICITEKSIQWCQHVRKKYPLSELIEKN